ncbi:uncharacterized protein LOC142586996 [Dermacentor variabilis]|uniref:uncharacterized protein LOC142586996 n=1 Tax=Dermacentor variabilis TaxID=34621 RepID=UPI003F5BD533
MSSSSLPRTPRRAQFYRAMEFVVMIILSSTILMISSCSIDCPEEGKPKAICVQGGPREGCNCTCVDRRMPCPPLESQLKLCDAGRQLSCPVGWEFLAGRSACSCRCILAE